MCERIRKPGRGAASGCRTAARAAALGCIWAALATALGCTTPLPPVPPAVGTRVYTAPPPSPEERYCAWYGARHGDVLYFGEAPFWSAMRAAGGDPTADLERAGPQRVGRFDLAAERMLPAIPVGAANGGEPRSGTWDVWSDGERLWFTTFFENAGKVDLATGEVRALALGRALNELAAGPDGTLLATRYGAGDGAGDGSVIAIGAAGRLLASWPVDAPAGYRSAPKTPVWDPARRELWVTTDLLPTGDGDAPIRHDAYRLAADGRLIERIAEPEIQFAARGGDGTLYFAEADGRDLWLRVAPPPGAGDERRVPLDDAFRGELDFVQDVQPGAGDDRRVVVTRWSGRVHVLRPDGSLRSIDLPRLDPQGLYYTGVVRGDRLCATYCADVGVVCVDAP